MKAICICTLDVHVHEQHGEERERRLPSKLVELFTSTMHSLGSASVAFNLPSFNAAFVHGDRD